MADRTDPARRSSPRSGAHLRVNPRFIMRMKIVTCLLTLTLLVLFVFSATVKAQHAFSEEELAKIKPEDVQKTMLIAQEAVAFFNFMSCENMLPSTPKGSIKRSESIIVNPEFPVRFPVKVVTNVEVKNTVPGYQKYTLEKAEANIPWRVSSGVQLNADSKKIFDLKLPSQEDQKKANDKLPELLKAESMDDPSTKTVKLEVGEMLLIKSKQGQALLQFMNFGDRSGVKSNYKWRYKANAEKKESYGEGSVFEKYESIETAASRSYLKEADKQTKVHAGPIQIAWSYGEEGSFGWFYYDPQELVVTKTTTTNFDTYKF